MVYLTLKNFVMPDCQPKFNNCQDFVSSIIIKPGRAFVRLCLAFLFIFTILFSFTSCRTGSPGFQLIVVAPELDEELLRVEVEPGDCFNLIYTHSVTGREVKGTFQVTGEGYFLPLTTEFDAFGPGLPELDAHQSYDISEGTITVYHNEDPRDRIGLFVSPLTGEKLLFSGREFDLTSRREDPKLIHIYVETGAD